MENVTILQNHKSPEIVMKILATKEGGKLLDEDLEKRARVIGLSTVENESGTIQINLTTDECEDFERMNDKQIDSDVMPDSIVSELVSFLENEGLLEKAV
jgi:hypothetical protein